MSSDFLREAVQASFALIRFDTTAFRRLGEDRAALRNSFAAMAMVAPFQLLLQAGGSQHNEAGTFLLLGLSFAITWMAYPVLTYELLRRSTEPQRLFRYLTAMNWLRLPEMILTVAVTLAAVLAQSTPLMWLGMIGFGLMGIGWRWFLARRALEAGRGLSVLLVLLFYVLQELIELRTVLVLDPDWLDKLSRVAESLPE